MCVHIFAEVLPDARPRHPHSVPAHGLPNDVRPVQASAQKTHAGKGESTQIPAPDKYANKVFVHTFFAIDFSFFFELTNTNSKIIFIIIDQQKLVS